MVVFTKYAKKQFDKLELRIQKQILAKLQVLRQNHLLLQQNLKLVSNLTPISHRVRIGSYRLLLSFDEQQQIYIIVKVAHRKEAYH